ncbi:MAG: ABC transporter ATP-binding protein [Pseudomonadota bacterium]
MTDTAIRVQNLSKCFQIYDTPRDRLKQFILPRVNRFAGREIKQYFREFWALKDVSFEIKKGETVGIVGRNGSGKSTLLQLICGTLNPTSGSVQTNGRIAALLELGSGFNPEFTGRENVYMNAAVLGLNKAEVDARFDDIAAFADIGQFIEQPVKTYSSGMMVRLAFAVAINVDPEILIVDEALSVGDELFQRKCFSRIEVIRANGATILFVSHSGAQIIQLCDRALLLDSGELLMSNAPRKIVGNYHKLISAPSEKRSSIRAQIQVLNQASNELNMQRASGEQAEPIVNNDLEDYYDPFLKPTSTIIYESHGAYIESPRVLTITGERVNNLLQGNHYRYVYSVKFERKATNVRFGMLIKTVSGLELGGAMSSATIGNSILSVDTGSVIEVEFEFKCILNTGVYFLNAGVLATVNEEDVHLHRLLDIEMFRVIPSTDVISVGTVNFECVAKVSAII